MGTQPLTIAPRNAAYLSALSAQPLSATVHEPVQHIILSKLHSLDQLSPEKRVAALEIPHFGKPLFHFLPELNNAELTFGVCVLVGDKHFKALAKRGGAELEKALTLQIVEHTIAMSSASDMLEKALNHHKVKAHTMMGPTPASAKPSQIAVMAAPTPGMVQ